MEPMGNYIHQEVHNKRCVKGSFGICTCVSVFFALRVSLPLCLAFPNQGSSVLLACSKWCFHILEHKADTNNRNLETVDQRRSLDVAL